MPRLRTRIDPAAARAKLDEAVAAVRREAEGTEGDPFDEAIVAAVAGLAEELKAEAGALAEIEARLARAARKA